jgi:hypothetical protein
MKSELAYFEKLIGECRSIKNLNREISKARRAFNHPHCFLPLSKIYELFGIESIASLKTKSSIMKFAELSNRAQAWMWSYTKEVYRVNPIIYNAFSQSDIDEIEWDQLKKLPSFCLYLDLSDCCDAVQQFQLVRGAFISVNEDEAFNESTFRIQLVTLDIKTTTYNFVTIPLYMNNKTVMSSFNEFIETAYNVAKVNDPKLKEIMRNQGLSLMRIIKNVLQCVLFIVNEDQDVKTKDIVYKLLYRQESPNNWLLPQRHKPTVFKVGYETAYKMQRAEKEAEIVDSAGLRTVSPHFRRAHWHGFWKNNVLVYKWLPPTFVGIKRKSA